MPPDGVITLADKVCMVASVDFVSEIDFFEESAIHLAIPKTEKEIANNDRITKLIPRG